MYITAWTVDYGSRVEAGHGMAVVEIPEPEVQLEEDQAQINRDRRVALVPFH